MEALIEMQETLEKTIKIQGSILELVDRLRKKVEELETSVAIMSKRVDKMQYAEC